MFHLYIFLGFLLLAWRLIYPLSISRTKKWGLTVLLLIISQYHLLLTAIFGNMFSPELPRWQVILLGWAFCTFVLMVPVTLVKDLIQIMWNISHKMNTLPSWRSISALLIVVIASSLSAMGVYNALQIPKVKQVTLEFETWPKALNGLKVVQITDLHISTLYPKQWTQQIVQEVNALNPDIILITGDFIDGTVNNRSEDIQPLSNLRSKYGTYGVLGNHEYYFDAKDWAHHIESLGINILENEHIVLNVNDEQLTIAGVTDESAAQFDLPQPDVPLALKNAPHDSPIILLKHQPINAEIAGQNGTDLQLSGHTHGGMIWGFNQMARYANQGLISGLYQLSSMYVYVSNGTALWNGFPIRLGVPSEITEITLHQPD